MTLPPEPPAGPTATDSTPDLPRWGLGDVVAGIVVSMVLSIVVGSLIYAVAGWSSSDDVPIWGLALLQVPLWAGYLGVTLWATCDQGPRRRSPTWGSPHGGSTRSSDWPSGIVTQLLVLPAAVRARSSGSPAPTARSCRRPAEELADRAGSAPSWLLFALLVGICAPVVEELFYRGLLLRVAHQAGQLAACRSP